jgi:hypothetical protein
MRFDRKNARLPIFDAAYLQVTDQVGFCAVDAHNVEWGHETTYVAQKFDGGHSMHLCTAIHDHARSARLTWPLANSQKKHLDQTTRQEPTPTTWSVRVKDDPLAPH